MNHRKLLVDLAFCIGADCVREHGVRIATYRGVGPCSIYIVCDDCYENQLTSDERRHMVEVVGADRVRDFGLHKLHLGRFSESCDL